MYLHTCRCKMLARDVDVKESFLPLWHVGPLNGLGQSHRKRLSMLTHCPPLRQGSGEHSSTSVHIYRINRLEMCTSNAQFKNNPCKPILCRHQTVSYHYWSYHYMLRHVPSQVAATMLSTSDGSWLKRSALNMLWLWGKLAIPFNSRLSRLLSTEATIRWMPRRRAWKQRGRLIISRMCSTIQTAPIYQKDSKLLSMFLQ